MIQRIRSGWNAFISRDPTSTSIPLSEEMSGFGYSSRPDRVRYTKGNQRSIVASIYNRISVDVASIKIEHAKLDKDGRYKESFSSGLNDCINVSANVDQTGRALIQDIVESMFDEGVVAVVPTDTNIDPLKTGSYDILELRTGKIIAWYPKW